MRTMNKRILALFAVLLLAGCAEAPADGGGDESDAAGTTDEGSKSADDGTDTTVDGGMPTTIANSQPADSTGVETDVSITFATFVGNPSASLTQATTIDVGGGVILSDARISIGEIKIKADRDRGEDELEAVVDTPKETKDET